MSLHHLCDLVQNDQSGVRFMQVYLLFNGCVYGTGTELQYFVTREVWKQLFALFLFLCLYVFHTL